MSIFSRIFGTRTPESTKSEPTLGAPDTVEKSGGWTSTNPGPSLLLNGLNPSHTGLPVSAYSALASAAVYGAVRALSEDVASLPLLVKRRLKSGGYVVDEQHAINDLFAEPNAHQTSFEFVSMLVTSLALYGNAFAYIRRRGDGSPCELIPVMAPSVSTSVNPLDGSVHYSMSSPMLGGTMQCLSEDVVHLKNIVLTNGYYGLSPIAAAQDVFSLSLQAQIHAAKIFAQGTTVSGVLEIPGKLSPEAASRMAQSWAQAYSSTSNAHKTPILEENCKFVPFEISPKDQQLLEARQFAVEEAARMFGIPPHRLGAMDRVSYSSLESQQQSYVSSTLQPICQRIEQAFARKLLFREERKRYRLEFDFKNLLRGDMDSRYKSYNTALLNGMLSVDEVREFEGLPPLPDGLGAEHRFPLNAAPGTEPTINTPAQDVPAPEPAGDADADTED